MISRNQALRDLPRPISQAEIRELVQLADLRRRHDELQHGVIRRFCDGEELEDGELDIEVQFKWRQAPTWEELAQLLPIETLDYLREMIDATLFCRLTVFEHRVHIVDNGKWIRARPDEEACYLG